MKDANGLRAVQMKILEIMKYIDRLCRANCIIYYIMGGTALGAVRHGGFIPWDDDLDIFMTPDQYSAFKKAFGEQESDKFVLQEWKTTPKYLEYAKVRMNGTTFIERCYADRKDMHHGIYVDIMILHKVPDNPLIQMLAYFKSKFVTLYALSQRNWVPKTKLQLIVLQLIKSLPCKWMAKVYYGSIYRYDHLKNYYKYCYWITPANLKSGLFDRTFFDSPLDIPFEDTILMGPKKINEYLSYRFGDYMKLPPKAKQYAAVHAEVYDTLNDFRMYIESSV